MSQSPVMNAGRPPGQPEAFGQPPPAREEFGQPPSHQQSFNQHQQQPEQPEAYPSQSVRNAGQPPAREVFGQPPPAREVFGQPPPQQQGFNQQQQQAFDRRAPSPAGFPNQPPVQNAGQRQQPARRCSDSNPHSRRSASDLLRPRDVPEPAAGPERRTAAAAARTTGLWTAGFQPPAAVAEQSDAPTKSGRAGPASLRTAAGV
ncbi:hypothetical protein THAOC_10840, partial [Thalassiosira oceanica]